MKVKPKRTFGWFLENGMFYLYTLLLLIGLVVPFVFFVTSLRQGINTTIGWQWKLTSLYTILSYYTLLVYLIGLLTLLILRKKTNKKISLTFLIAIALILFYDFMPYSNYAAVYYFKMAMFIVFLVLFFQALFRKQKPKIT